jgi:hypothetical protein
MKLASEVGLRSLSDELLTVPTNKGANPGLKVSSLVAGADSIDDMAILRHGGMRNVFDAEYAPSTLGSFLRQFTFGNVRRLDAVACRVLAGLNSATPLLSGVDGDVLVDVDDTMIKVHGYAKQGGGFRLLGRDDQWRFADRGHHRDHPAHPDQRSRPDRDLSSADHLAPADQPALTDRLGSSIRAGLRTATRTGPLTNPDKHNPNTK